MDELEKLKKELADVKQVNAMLADGLATMGVAYVNQRVNLLTDELWKLKARVGDIETGEQRRDDRISKASYAFKRMEGRVGRLEFNQPPAKATA